MKKVIFLCLLSLSVSFSKPAEDPAAPKPPTESKAVDANITVTETQNKTAEQVTTPLVVQNQTAPNNKEAAPASNVTVLPSNKTDATPTDTKASDASKPADDNKTTGKETSTKQNDVTEPTQKSSETKAATDDKPEPNKDVKPEDAKVNNGTKPEKDVTPKTPDTPKSTEPPKADKDKHIVQARGFDGPSFIGGIILTLGLLAVGFMGFKYYKNQTERNYHTL